MEAAVLRTEAASIRWLFSCCFSTANRLIAAVSVQLLQLLSRSGSFTVGT